MSDAPRTRVPSPSPVPDAGELLASLDPLLRGWLPRQRWFAGKGRPVTGFTLVSLTELLPWRGGRAGTPGLLHLLVRADQEADRPGDCYQLFLGVRAELPPHLAHALIGRPEAGPLAGHTVYEALQDPRPAELLLERMRLPGRLGELRFGRDARVTIPTGLAPRPLGSEQSNSSLVYGDTFILKLFRRVVPGANPDLELPLVLSRQGCARVPAPVAWMQAEPAGGAGGEPYVLGVLQPFLKGSQDGWELALRRLAAGEDFTAEARALGRATAEVHTALAGALPALTLGPEGLAALADAMTRRLEEAAAAVPELRPYVPGLRTAFARLGRAGREGRTWTAQRVHGDLHLGQCLRSADGYWSLIDFEGEPARPLAERRRAFPPVRDVAGMLRSFDYAARSHEPWAPEWASACRAAYCEGYAEIAGRDPREDADLLTAYETDKAVYEVLYEARHRPDWLPVPLAAIARLAGDSQAREAREVRGARETREVRETRETRAVPDAEPVPPPDPGHVAPARQSPASREEPGTGRRTTKLL
ncbi:maltokinase N-terminal cap-like domain-containing protein [Streptomyces sp. P6-2-1]|uniref:maltokinase N-terminal cap-like domain-containing protein n=1 Tax=unclassified Streptomyces TaxID=2593676 RepID=UPI003D366114